MFDLVYFIRCVNFTDHLHCYWKGEIPVKKYNY